MELLTRYDESEKTIIYNQLKYCKEKDLLNGLTMMLLVTFLIFNVSFKGVDNAFFELNEKTMEFSLSQHY